MKSPPKPIHLKTKVDRKALEQLVEQGIKDGTFTDYSRITTENSRWQVTSLDNDTLLVTPVELR